MGIFDELKDRGIIAQMTHEDEIRDMLNREEGVKFYVGFDPTADSLHVGHFVPIMVMAHLQRAGHVPIALFGGGTGMIGDPSGKTDMRPMMTRETIDHNISCFKEQMSSLVDFSVGKAIMVNNADWLLNLNYIEFLRDIGVHFSVNRMLAAEAYKERLNKGLTFFEMNYMIMQSYDYLVLNRDFECELQIGGDDQWSNIISGADLVRRVDKKRAYGMTFQLLQTSTGHKMGKTESGALWLDPTKTSPYEFYQYWRNVDDADVINSIKMLTFIPMSQICEYEKAEGAEMNNIKEILAFEVTKIIHGEEEAKKAENAAKAIFTAGSSSDNMPTTALTDANFENNEISVLDACVFAEIAVSKSQVRRLIKQGGITIDDKRVTDHQAVIKKSDFDKGEVLIRRGRKNFHKLILA